MTADHPRGTPPGAPLDDLALGQLLGDGLRHQAGGPVDGRALVAGARVGAVRIRRRRKNAVTALALLVVALPAGVLGSRLFTRDAASSGLVTAAEASPSEASLSQPEAAMDSAAGTGAASRKAAGVAGPMVSPSAAPVPSAAPASGFGNAATTQMVAPTVLDSAGLQTPSGPAGEGAAAKLVAPLPRTAAGAVEIPDAAVLTAAGVRAGVPQPFALSSDTSNLAPATVVTAAELCGKLPAGLPAEAGGRDVRFGSGGWTAGGAVRVFAGSGAARYVTGLLSQEGCLASQAPPGTSTVAAAGHGATDAQGHTPWFAIALAGRTVVEVRVAVPAGGTVTAAELRVVLASAVSRAESCGLTAAAAADQSLG